MSIGELMWLIRWDVRVNRGPSFENLRAILLLLEVRLEQFIYRRIGSSRYLPARSVWYLGRFLGSIYQWLLANSQIPGSVQIGRGLRLPHPQSIVIRWHAEIGEFCTIYHNASIVWSGFREPVSSCPSIGDRVLIGSGAIIIGEVTIGDDVLIGAGAIVPKSVPSYSRVVMEGPKVTPRHPSEDAAEPGSARHLRDPYSIWR